MMPPARLLASASPQAAGGHGAFPLGSGIHLGKLRVLEGPSLTLYLKEGVKGVSICARFSLCSAAPSLLSKPWAPKARPSPGLSPSPGLGGWSYGSAARSVPEDSKTSAWQLGWALNSDFWRHKAPARTILLP